MSQETYKVEVFAISLIADAGEREGNLFKIEYTVVAKGITGRFLTPVEGFDESKVPELLRADLTEMLPAIQKLEEIKEQFEGKILDV